MSDRFSQIPRVNVLGVGISAVDLDSATAEIRRWVEEKEKHYVCVTGVHGVMESQTFEDLRKIHNRSGLTVPDGVPMVWSARYAGEQTMRQVRGADLMLRVLAEANDRGWKSFFYGGKQGVPEQLAEQLSLKLPQLQVAGCYSPPFRELSPEEDRVVVDLINASGADLVWIGLSTPKQERWAAAHIDCLDARVLLAVGAAFDFHAGLIDEAPRWIQGSGFEWLYRLFKEPGRLWRRYMRNNPLFVMKIVRRPPSIQTATNQTKAAGSQLTTRLAVPQSFDGQPGASRPSSPSDTRTSAVDAKGGL